MKTVLITGASKGIGKALADKFLAEGYAVIGTYLSGDVSSQQGMPNFAQYKLDLSAPKSIAAFADAVSSLPNPVDILMSNAGVLLDDEETVLDPDKLRKTLEVNVIGAADLIEKLLPRIARPAHIVFTSSGAGSLHMTEQGISHHPGYYPAYKISKAALNMYAVTLAHRLLGEGITVSAVHPGWVKTDIGGQEADIAPEEAAADIFALAISHPKTGGFWFKGKRLPW